MNDRLYIIGNGFDLHHNIPSSCWQFGEYLREHAPETYRTVEQYFDVDDMFWAEFEDRLASVNVDFLIDDASQFLVGYGADDWSDSFHHDYQYEIEVVVRALSTTMLERFGDWVRQLPLPDQSAIAGLRLPVIPNARFLNFNYTPSLQTLYGVPNINVLHVHGAACDPNAQLVLGHGWKQEPNPDPYRMYANPEDADIRIVEGQGIIDNYFQSTFKPTEDIIKANSSFFADLKTVRDVYVLGHSVSRVDHPYFEEVVRNLDPFLTRWTISYYSGLSELKDRVNMLGIPCAQVAFKQLKDL